jgi:hypothetical protein
MHFCVLKYKMTQWPTTYHFSTKSNFHSVLICIVYAVYKYKIAQYSHNFYSIYSNTEGVFFMSQGCKELTPLVANFCTNMAVEKNLEGYGSILLHAQGLQSMLFYYLTLTLFCIVLCFEHVKSCFSELSKLFLLYLWRVNDYKTTTKHFGFH